MCPSVRMSRVLFFFFLSCSELKEGWFTKALEGMKNYLEGSVMAEMSREAMGEKWICGCGMFALNGIIPTKRCVNMFKIIVLN